MPLPQIYNLSTNALESVPEEEIADRVLAGTHAFGGKIDIPVVDADGEAWSLPSEQIPAALRQGYELETSAVASNRERREKYGKGFATTLRAFGEQVARAATFGASDYAFQAFGAEKEELAARKEFLGTLLSVAADVVGIGGSLLVPGGQFTAAGRVAAAGKATAGVVKGALGVSEIASAGSRAAARAAEAFAGTAVEGAAYSAGMVLSEKALGDPELTASRALGDIGFGALLGGGLGVFGKGLSAGASKMKAELEKVLDPDALAKLSGQMEGKGLGLAARPGKHTVPTSDLGTWANTEAHAILDGKPIGGVTNAKTAQKRAASVMDDALDRQSGFTFELDAKVPGGVDLGDIYRPRTEGDAGGRMWKILDELDDPAYSGIRDDITGVLTEYHEAFKAAPVSFTRAIEHKRAVSEFLKSLWNKEINRPAVARAKVLRHMLNEAIDDRITVAAKSVDMDPALWMKAKKDYGWAAEIERASGKLAKNQEKFRLFSLSDYLIGTSLGMGSASLPAAVLGGMVHKVGREWGNQVISAALDRVSKLDFLRKSAATSERRMAAAMARLAGSKGKQRQATLAADTLSDIAEASDFSKDAPMPAGILGLDVIDRFATNPDLLADALEKSLAPVREVAPQVAASMAAQIARAVFYLHAVAPRPPRQEAFSGPPRPVSALEVRRFNGIAEVVADPVKLMEHAATGTITTAMVQALADTQPATLEEFQVRAWDELAGKEIRPENRAAIATLLSIKLVEADTLAAFQATFAKEAEVQAQMSQGGMAKIDLGSEAVAGESEGLEMRRLA